MLGALWLKHLPIDKYTVTVHYYGGSSDELAFEVIEPEGSSRSEYNELMSAYHSKKEHDIEYVYTELKNFIKRYPNSVYTQKAYWDRGDYKEIFEKYPNSGYNRMTLSFMLHNLSLEDKQKNLQKIISDNPDSRSAKYARQILKNQTAENKEE